MRALPRTIFFLLLACLPATAADGLSPTLDGAVVEFPKTWNVRDITFDDVPLVKANAKGVKGLYKGTATERWRTGEIRPLLVKAKLAVTADGSLVLKGSAKPLGKNRKSRPRGRYAFRMVDGIVERVTGRLVVDGPAGILKHDLVMPADETGTIRAVGSLRTGRPGWNANFESYRPEAHFERMAGLHVDAAGTVYVSDEFRISRWTSDGLPAGWIGGGKEGWGTHATPERGDDGWFVIPAGVHVTDDGTIYVGDLDRVRRWSADGKSLGWLGGGYDGWQTTKSVGRGEEDGHVRNVKGVFVDDAGNVFAADSDHHRIVKWTADGTYVGWIGGAVNGWQQGKAPLGHGHFRSYRQPKGVFVDGDGFIYVADTRNYRIVKRDADGLTIGWIGGGVDGWQTGDAPEASGEGLREFRNPHSVFVASNGDIYVADDNERVSKWDEDGTAIGWMSVSSDGWRTDDADTAGPNRVADVHVTEDGTIYLASSGRHRVDRFSADLTEHHFIGDGQVGWQPPDASPPEDETFSFGARDVFAAPDGYLYVVDGKNDRVIRFTKEGQPVGWIGGGRDGWRTDPPTDESVPRGDYRAFDDPTDVHVDGEGSIFVLDYGSHRVSKWDRDGAAIGWVGGGRDGWQQGVADPDPDAEDYRSFPFPDGLWVDEAGGIYVANGNRVLKWSADGEALGWIGSGRRGWQKLDAKGYGASYDRFNNAAAITTDAAGNIYVAEPELHRVSVWTKDGQPKGWIGGGKNGLSKDDAHMWQTDGRGARAFDEPTDVWINDRGFLFVADSKNHRVSRWRIDQGAPRFAGWFGHGMNGWHYGPAPKVTGRDFRHVYDLYGVAGDASGNLYVRNSLGISWWKLPRDAGRGKK